MPRPNPLFGRLLALAVGLLGLPGCGREGSGPGAPATPRYGADGALPAGTPRPSARPNLLIVLVEQLRHDALPASALPGAAAFQHAVSPCPEAAAAWASLLTGHAPWQHRVTHGEPFVRLEPGYVTLPEILRIGAGYATRAFVAGERLARSPTLWQGLEVHPERVGLVEAPEALAVWTQSLAPGTPWCAVLHADEALPPYGEANHVPRVLREVEPFHLLAGTGSDVDLAFTSRPGYAYLREGRRRQGGEAALVELERARLRWLWQPPDPASDLPGGAAARAARWRSAYDAGAVWIQGLLSRLAETARTLGGLENTLVLVTSSGGTAFLEHGIVGPGRHLYDEQVRIPFAWLGSRPWAGRGALRATASLVDVLPTLLDLLGLPALQGLEGRSLIPALAGVDVERPVISEERQDGDNTGDPAVRATLVSVRTPRWKYVVRFDLRAGTVVEQAFDLRDDPLERADLAQAGIASKVPFDGAMCIAVERVRDGLWGAVAATNRTGGEIYSAGQPVRGQRPPPCGR